MPELPEVETTLRGIEPHILNIPINKILVRAKKLRWPIPEKTLKNNLIGNSFYSINRRAKYLIFKSKLGHLLVHLGMSGCLKILHRFDEPNKHDHLDFVFKNGTCLRFTDPRKFGSILWTQDPEKHFLIKNLGPEPLGNSFSGTYLFEKSRRRKLPIKSFIMNANVVSGIGNIYANEALFLSGIRPQKKTGTISQKQFETLALSIKNLLHSSIDQGGTTLRDFVSGNNRPGYFQNELLVYGRSGKNCFSCSSKLKEIRLAQRSSVYCPLCQS